MDGLLRVWYREHGRNLPWRHTRDPFAILVSEVMLQQTQVERVVPRYLAWLERWPTAEALAAASTADVIREWQGLGYNRRAVNLQRAARVVAKHGWPEDLTKLPGVGPYTAAAIGNFALGRPVLPVDVNVQRVQERTCHEFEPSSAQALMDLGATICLARVPRCGACPLAGGVGSTEQPRSEVPASPAPERKLCPSRGRRYEPLRKQSRFEGSFRQRRAATLRLVATGERPLVELDREAVESLAADGLVTLADGVAMLPS
jgi:A/G-specific adenine glycosylase